MNLLRIDLPPQDEGPDDDRRDLEPIDFTRLVGQPAPARRWMVDEWIPARGATLVAGDGGTGKSLLAQATALHLASGERYFASVPEHRRVLGWFCEDDLDELWRRQASITEAVGLPLDAGGDNLLVVPRAGLDNVLAGEVRLSTRAGLAKTKLFDLLAEQVLDEHVELLLLDNLAHVLDADHDDRIVATAFVNLVAGIVAPHRDFAVVLVGHVARASGSEFTGSVAWSNACRSRLLLSRREPGQTTDAPVDSGVRWLSRLKANYAAAAVQDGVRLRWQHGALVVDRPSNHVDAMARRTAEEHADNVLVSAYHSIRLLNLEVTAGRSSPDHLPRRALDLGFGAGQDRQQLDAALHRLLARGTLVVIAAARYGSSRSKRDVLRHKSEIGPA